jgi:deoxyribonuclease (pyrimidine dimer)
MTRINCVPPQELHDKHLAAEYYELPRVFGLVRKALEKGIDPTDIPAPENYTLGEGHVKFFYTRLGYCLKRQASIIAELIHRKKKPDVRWLDGLAAGIPEHLLNDWTPDEAAMMINRQRLEERLTQILAKPKRPVPSIND